MLLHELRMLDLVLDSVFLNPSSFSTDPPIRLGVFAFHPEV